MERGAPGFDTRRLHQVADWHAVSAPPRVQTDADASSDSLFLMLGAESLTWQPSLFDTLTATGGGSDMSFSNGRRIDLDGTAWVDHLPGWRQAPGQLFEWLLTNAPWRTGEMVIHGKRVVQPRLLAGWSTTGAEGPLPEQLEQMRARLSAHYGRLFDSVGVNLYRHGRDSVAWHGDRIASTVEDPLVAIVSLGHPRRFLLRPVGGRTALTLLPQPGDLVVMGGSSQRTWQHTIPKSASAGPRISVTFRHSTNHAPPSSQ
jgi:alkylated DNA repair dioxygenase AlkB